MHKTWNVEKTGNSFYYTHVPENQLHIKGPWSHNETIKFIEFLKIALKKKEYRDKRNRIFWGKISLELNNGRTGLQCYDSY